MNNSCPSPMPDVTTSQTENELLQLLEDGPVKNTGKPFAEILTVPQELREKIFYWSEEREFCEHISSVGRALDTLTAVHRTFLGQFKVLSNLRATLIQAPTEFFVAPMYLCDRALDSLLRSTRKVQNDIKQLFKDLSQLESECMWRYRWTRRAYLEDKFPKDTATGKESAGTPDMERKQQRVKLLAELIERIGMVRRGGASMFSLLGRQWLPGYAQSAALQEPKDVVMTTAGDVSTRQKDPSIEKGSGDAQLEIEGSGSIATPIPQYRASIGSRLATDNENPVEVPETPEVSRTGCVVITQRSSPRKQKPSQSSGKSEATDTEKDAQTVARNLIRDDAPNLQDSPAPKSGASIQAIRAISQRDRDATTVRGQVDTGNLPVRNQVGFRLPDVGNNRPASSREQPSDARMAFPNLSQDQEKHDEEGVRSLSI